MKRLRLSALITENIMDDRRTKNMGDCLGAKLRPGNARRQNGCTLLGVFEVKKESVKRYWAISAVDCAL
jgi:hypothetical protein